MAENTQAKAIKSVSEIKTKAVRNPRNIHGGQRRAGKAITFIDDNNSHSKQNTQVKWQQLQRQFGVMIRC